jgi:ABC-2 type transport system ATP-binding protein
VINVEHLFYEYPRKRALDDVTFTIPEGSITALVGPNGAGKTTLLRCIAGLDEPFSGKIRVGGIDVSENPRQVHKELGYLSDFFGLYNELTIEQCLTFTALIHQLPDEKIKERVQWVTELLELTPYFTKNAGTLSRGWRQRLGIAQAIIHRPRLLLLDEPASGLDPEARVTLSVLFRRLRDEGMTLLVSSHILAELEDYCTDMLVLREGRVVEHSVATSHKKDRSFIEITFLDSAQIFVSKLQEMAMVANPVLDERTIRFTFSGGEEDQHKLLKNLMAMEAKISLFTVQRSRLQDVYMSLSNEGKKI